MYSGRYVETGILQTLLDDLFAKSSRPIDNCILSLFENNYLARTGVNPPGGNYPSNNWRNNFNLQKGIGCYAPISDVSSNTFLNEGNLNCRYLIPRTTGRLTGASCSLSTSGATYRNEDHRKWLKISVDNTGYSVVDILNIANFSPYVAPSGNRIPVLPLIVALYFDANESLVIGTRTAVDILQFKNDFNFSHEEFVAYFDDSSQHF
jgi:hypothetical protein